MKVSVDKAGPSRQATKPEKGKKLVQPTKRFDGIELSTPKNFNRNSYSSLDGKVVPNPPKHAKEKSEAGKQVRFEDDLESSDEENKTQPATPIRRVVAPEGAEPKKVSRPFDAIPPIEVTPIPRNLPRGVIPTPIKDKENPSTMRQSKGKGDDEPAYKLRSENFRPGLVDDVAKRIMSTTVSLTAKEVCEISPQVRKAILRKNRNQRVPVQRASQFVYEEPDPEDESSRKDRFKDLPEATIPLAAQ